jgi:hypothetical protein
MIIAQQNIENFIPQRPPFIMIDNLIEASADLFRTDFRILQDNIFVENGFLQEFALIENIAQSSSAGLVFTKLYAGKEKADGYIGGVSKLILYELPKVDETIYTIVNLIARLEHMFLLKGVNYAGSRKLMECEIKLVGM